MIRYSRKEKNSIRGSLPSHFTKIILFSTLLNLNSFAFAEQNYLMSIKNGSFTDQNKFEFDVFIKSISDDFELTSYQSSLFVNEGSLNGGTLTFSYIEGSSVLSNKPSACIGVNNSDGSLKLTFASMPGSDNITESEVKVGRFIIESTKSFNGDIPSVGWCFSGNVNTILTGTSFRNITVPGNHYSEMAPTSINNETFPESFELHQNYPNPFNPSTTIRFDIPKQAHVNLSVFNVLGERVAQLADEILSPGQHEFIFNADLLASGIYIYVVDVEKSFTERKKMVLLK